MNEEMNVVETEVLELATTDVSPIDVETYDISKERNQKLALAGAGIALIGGISWLIVNRQKIKNWVNEKRIKKLEKDGYSVGYTNVPCGNKNSEVVVKTEEETK